MDIETGSKQLKKNPLAKGNSSRNVFNLSGSSFLRPSDPKCQDNKAKDFTDFRRGYQQYPRKVPKHIASISTVMSIGERNNFPFLLRIRAMSSEYEFNKLSF